MVILQTAMHRIRVRISTMNNTAISFCKVLLKGEKSHRLKVTSFFTHISILMLSIPFPSVGIIIVFFNYATCLIISAAHTLKYYIASKSRDTHGPSEILLFFMIALTARKVIFLSAPSFVLLTTFCLLSMKITAALINRMPIANPINVSPRPKNNSKHPSFSQYLNASAMHFKAARAEPVLATSTWTTLGF